MHGGRADAEMLVHLVDAALAEAVRFADDDPPPCRVCLTAASREEIERCRAATDPEGIEQRLLAEIDEPETVVTFASDVG